MAIALSFFAEHETGHMTQLVETAVLDASSAHVVAQLVRECSIEMNVPGRFVTSHRAGRCCPLAKVYISHLPKQTWRQTLDACRAVSAEGFDPVPHIPVRLLEDERSLDTVLANAVCERGSARGVADRWRLSATDGAVRTTLRVPSAGVPNPGRSSVNSKIRCGCVPMACGGSPIDRRASFCTSIRMDDAMAQPGASGVDPSVSLRREPMSSFQLVAVAFAAFAIWLSASTLPPPVAGGG